MISETPKRGASLAHDQFAKAWETKHLELKRSSEVLKRKVSETSFKEDKKLYTRLRIQDFELDIDQTKHDLKYWDNEHLSNKCDTKTLKQQRVEGQKRVQSLGQRVWEETRLLNKIQDEERGYEILTPDYGGAFSATLLSLYKDPLLRSKRKSRQQFDLRADCIARYGSRNQEALEELWCPVTHTYWPAQDVVAAHLVPCSLARGIAEYLFGQGSSTRIDTPDNCLMLSRPVERALDNQQLVFIPADMNEDPIVTWQVHLTTEDVKNTTMYPGAKFRDIQGRKLQFHNNARPAKRFLYYVFIVTIALCRDRRSNGWEKNMEICKGTPFATCGKYLRKSVMLHLARGLGDISPDFEDMLASAFEEEEELNDREHKEIARQVVEAATEKGQEGTDLEEDDDTEEEGVKDVPPKEGRKARDP